MSKLTLARGLVTDRTATLGPNDLLIELVEDQHRRVAIHWPMLSTVVSVHDFDQAADNVNGLFALAKVRLAEEEVRPPKLDL